MKHNKVIYIVFFLVISIVFVACKKERSPRLIVTVKNASGVVVSGASVRVHPGDPSNFSGVVNKEIADKTVITDGQGVAIFEFEFSAVLDIDVVDHVVGSDTLSGHSVVKIESVRQRDSSNDFAETLELK